MEVERLDTKAKAKLRSLSMILMQRDDSLYQRAKVSFDENPQKLSSLSDIAEAIFGKSASYVLEHWTEIDSACSAYKVFEGEKSLAT